MQSAIDLRSMHNADDLRRGALLPGGRTDLPWSDFESPNSRFAVTMAGATSLAPVQSTATLLLLRLPGIVT